MAPERLTSTARAGERRVLVAGASGSGKTTLARSIAERTGLTHTEIDSLYHGPGWAPRSQFEDDVDALVAREAWVCEWQYRLVRERLLARAELLVWLDLPRRVVTWRVVRRTVLRRLRHEELWNGNREGPLIDVLRDRDHIIQWSWRTWPTYATSVPQAAERHPHLRVVRLRSVREVERWIAQLAGPGVVGLAPRPAPRPEAADPGSAGASGDDRQR